MKIVLTTVSVLAASGVALAQNVGFPPPVGTPVLVAGFDFANHQYEGAVYYNEVLLTELPANFSDLTPDDGPQAGARATLQFSGQGFSDVWNADFLGDIFGWQNAAVQSNGNLTLNQTINTPLRDLGSQRFNRFFDAVPGVDPLHNNPFSLALNPNPSLGRDRISFQINNTNSRIETVTFAHRVGDLIQGGSGFLNVYLAGDVNATPVLLNASPLSVTTSAAVATLSVPQSLADALDNDSSVYLIIEMTQAIQDNFYLVDNLQIVGFAIPEPSTYGLMAGVLGLAVVLWRRRR